MNREHQWMNRPDRNCPSRLICCSLRDVLSYTCVVPLEWNTHSRVPAPDDMCTKLYISQTDRISTQNKLDFHLPATMWHPICVHFPAPPSWTVFHATSMARKVQRIAPRPVFQKGTAREHLQPSIREPKQIRLHLVVDYSRACCRQTI